MFGHQGAKGVGYNDKTYSMGTQALLLGPSLGASLGYAWPTFRLGLRASGWFGGIAAGGDSIPYTDLSAAFGYTLGPVVGLRPSRTAPIEIELEVAYAAQHWVGSRYDIGAPDNLYPLGTTQHGAALASRLYWRPLGWSSIWALYAGIRGSIAYAKQDNVSSLGMTAGGELGMAVGF